MDNTYSFVVHFEGLGFYAKKQPNYYWAFTSDWKKANEYATVKGATALIDRASKIEKYARHQPTIRRVVLTRVLAPIAVEPERPKYRYFNGKKVTD
jgi:hypothetical protein